MAADIACCHMFFSHFALESEHTSLPQGKKQEQHATLSVPKCQQTTAVVVHAYASVLQNPVAASKYSALHSLSDCNEESQGGTNVTWS